MILHTASEVISFARDLENAAGEFYRGLAARYPAAEFDFPALADDSRKNIVQIERAYYGVISDALEGCFAFDIETDLYKLEPGPVPEPDLPRAVARAVKMETVLEAFYREAARQSQSLMADVPRSFVLIANKRQNRIALFKGPGG